MAHGYLGIYGSRTVQAAISVDDKSRGVRFPDFYSMHCYSPQRMGDLKRVDSGGAGKASLL